MEEQPESSSAAAAAEERRAAEGLSFMCGIGTPFRGPSVNGWNGSHYR